MSKKTNPRRIPRTEADVERAQKEGGCVVDKLTNNEYLIAGTLADSEFCRTAWESDRD